MPATVHLAAPPDDPADDLRAVLAAAGFAVTAGPPGAADVLVVVAGADPRALRADREGVPVVWVVPTPDGVAAGLDAGADAVVPREAAPAVLAAQVRALLRRGEERADLAGRAAGARGLNAQLQKALADIERGVDLAGRVHAAMGPGRPPAGGAVRFAAHARPPARPGEGLWGYAGAGPDQVGVWAADCGGGPGPWAGGLVGALVRHAVRAADGRGPAGVVEGVNRALLGLGVDPPPLVGLAYLVLDGRTGAAAAAGGGGPAVVFLPADGPAELWAGTGPFLGAFAADFPPRVGRLGPGDRLLVAAGGGTGPGPVPAAAERHRALAGPALAAAVAGEVGAAVVVVAGADPA